MDGTIWDSRETIVKAWNDELKAQGIDRVITVSELTGYMGLTMDAIAEGIFPDKSIPRQNIYLIRCMKGKMNICGKRRYTLP